MNCKCGVTYLMKRLLVGKFHAFAHMSSARVNSHLLEVSGVDAKKFVQGLCTNDLTKLVEPGACMPASFLTSKGRIFANSLLYLKENNVHNGASTILIELPLPQSSVNDVQKYLTMYKLRSKVTIKPAQVQCTFTTTALCSTNSSDLEKYPNAVLMVKDPRIEGFGSRVLQSLPPENNNFENDQQDVEWYDRYKLVHGFAEGPEVGNKIPLECNLDLLHYISFAKGCYIGQELTARTKFKGLVRKRLVPFLLAPDSTTSSTNNTGTFEPISESLKSQLTTRDYSGLASTATLARIMTGAQVYADLASSKSIGEVVHVDSTGTIGVAMLQQAALVNSQGNFIVRPRPVEATGGELEVEVGGELPAQSSGSSPSEGEPESAAAPAVFDANAPVSYISTYRPDWFQGLDERTGNVLDL